MLTQEFKEFNLRFEWYVIMNDVILEVENLQIYYHAWDHIVRAVKGVSFAVRKDEVFGLVGESGCGKSTLAMGIMRAIQPPGKIEGGRVMFNDIDLITLSENRLRDIRWKDISYIPQGAMSSLNPVTRIREQFHDVFRDHGYRTSRREIDKQIEKLLDGVQLSPVILDRFSHELSGGMKQRTCIALSMALHPKLILADEPTSALDVVSQRTVLETLAKARRELQASMILIGHDMGLQAQISDRIGVMYAGNFVEIGSVGQIFSRPTHPYTQRLLASLPSIHKKQDIAALARAGLSEEEKRMFATPHALEEIERGHFVAQLDDREILINT